MKVDIDLKNNAINIINQDVNDIDFNYDLEIFGNDELLYGLKNDKVPKGYIRWHCPGKKFKSYDNVKIVLKNMTNCKHKDIDPYGEEIWDDFIKCWKIETIATSI